MAKTPARSSLSVASSRPTGSGPPRELGQHGLEFWREIQAAYQISDVGGRSLLMEGAATVDLIEAQREAIQRDGVIINGPAGPKSNPAVKDLIAARALLCRILQRLGITDESTKPGPGRPPTPFGWTGRT